MVLPATRATSTGNVIAFDTLPVANSGKSVDEMIGLGDTNPTFGGLTASDFTSYVVEGEITEGDQLLEYTIHDQSSYARNVASLSGKSMENSSSLAGSDISDACFEKPNLRDCSTLFAPDRFSSPAIDTPDRKVLKPVVDSSLVKLRLVSSGEVGNIICDEKIGSGQNL